MDKIALYRKRAKQLYFAFIGLLSLMLIGCLVIYPYFKLPIADVTRKNIIILLSIVGIGVNVISFGVKKKIFPIKTSENPLWSSSATGRYMTVFAISSLPFDMGFLLFVVFGDFYMVFVGYLISLAGLLLTYPKASDIAS
ncbi:MAG: hypothetical protein NZL90_03650 [Aquificaceae bacterium]|nr:hypothetical protein [Aquificaceae bacterium]MDW8237408.1 hypothetical protein [Aquificaceae bacterium]